LPKTIRYILLLPQHAFLEQKTQSRKLLSVESGTAPIFPSPFPYFFSSPKIPSTQPKKSEKSPKKSKKSSGGHVNYRVCKQIEAHSMKNGRRNEEKEEAYENI
jgi:hypothetical protein